MALVVAMALLVTHIPNVPAMAQSEHGAIPSLELASTQPGQMVITWETPDPAPTDYRIRWANTDLGFPSYSAANEAERGNEYPLGNVTTLTLNNLTPGDSYKVQIRSRYYNADRSVHESSGPWTATATQRVKDHPPAAPTGLAASQVSHDSLTLTWGDPQNANITGYRVQRGPDGNSLSTIQANTGSPSTSYTDSTVEPETTYHYAVLAMSQDGDGPQSSTSVTTPAEPQSEDDSTPAAPTGLTASQVTHESLTLTWDNPEDDSITGYEVLRGPDADSLSTLENDTESVSTRYEDNTVEQETTYHYAILAFSTAGDGPQSSTISATTPAEPADSKSKDPTPKRVVPRQAPTLTTFISNTGQSSGGGSNTVRATEFTTGAGTYTVSEVRIYISTQTGSPTPLVRIYQNDSGNPGSTIVATMTNPTLTESAVNIFTAPANTTLSATTTYWLVTSNSADTNGQGFHVGTISNTTLDSSTAAGWSIGNARFKSSASNPWGNSGGRHRFQIRGTVPNTPAAGAPAITAPNVFRVPAVLTADLSGITDTDGVINIATNATYKWQRFDSTGVTLDTDSIGTGSTYTLTDTDAGKTLKMVVNFTDDANNSEGPLTSAATPAITAAATDCNAPTLTGGAVFLGSAKKVGIGTYADGTFTYYGFSKSSGAGSLDNATFTTTNSSTHEILRIVTTTSGTTLLALETDTRLSAADRMTVALHACDQAYPIASGGDPSTDPAIYIFSTSPQDWSTHAERTIYLSQDTTAPTFVSATVNGTTLVVTLSEDLGTASLANGDFTVKKNGVTTALTLSSTAPARSGSMVTLTLAAAAAVIATDTNVLVSYTKPTSGTDNKLVDTFGNETATFTDQAVTNTVVNTPAAGLPTISGTAQVNLTLTASTADITDTDGLPSVFTYQWKRVDDDGVSNPTNIGADSDTYTLTTSEVGKKILVEVSFTDNATNSEGPLVSAAYPSSGTVSARTGLTVTQREDWSYTFRTPDFNNLPGGGGQTTSVKITALPGKGSLTLENLQITSRDLPKTLDATNNQLIRLRYRPPADGNGIPFTSFKFKVNESSTEYTMIINITPVNDPPYGRVFITGPAQVGYDLTALTASIGDRDGIPSTLNYQWKRYAADGITFEQNIGTNSSTYRLTDSEQGKKIKLEVSYIDGGGTREVRLSHAFPYIATQMVGEATFISTTGMAGDASHYFTTQDQGQVFTTGRNPNGYTVTSVVIISEDTQGDEVALKICEVDSSLHPTTVCTNLTPPGMFPAGPLVFTAPPETTLEGDRTNYMVVFNSPGGTHVSLDSHTNDGYDSSTLTGFSIRNKLHFKNTTTWQEVRHKEALRIAVLGTINP